MIENCPHSRPNQEFADATQSDGVATGWFRSEHGASYNTFNKEIECLRDILKRLVKGLEGVERDFRQSVGRKMQEGRCL